MNSTSRAARNAKAKLRVWSQTAKLSAPATIDMTIALKPYAWGRQGLRTMVDYLNGEEVEGLVEIDSLLIDQDNIDEVNFDEIR